MATDTQEVREDKIGIRDLLEAGLHFGHQTKRWNPKMKRYIFDTRNGIHIIDLAKSLVLLEEALKFIHDVVAGGRSVLFVGTKKQAQQIIKDTASSSAQHYVTHRWLGGTLTNNGTIRKSINRMQELENLEKPGGFDSMHKKEAANLRRELEKLRRNLSGVANMKSLPGAMFVVDINREAIAVKEANTLHIPIVAIVDTNCNPDPVDCVIPGNDDAIRAVRLITGAVAKTIQQASAEHASIASELARQQDEAKQARAAQAAKPVAESGSADTAGSQDKAKEAASRKRPTSRPTKERKSESKPPAPAKEAAAAPADGPATPAPVEAPVETPVVEAPVIEAPVVEAPPAEAPAADKPAAE